MEFFNFFSVSTPLLKFCLVIMALFWYEGLLPLLVNRSNHPMHIFSSLGWVMGIIASITAQLTYFIFFTLSSVSKFFSWRRSGFTTMYGDFFVSVSSISYPLTMLTSSTTRYYLMGSYVTSALTGLILFLDYSLSWVLYLLSLIKFFFQLALLPIKVTYIFMLFWYRIFLDLKLEPSPSQWISPQRYLDRIMAGMEYYYSYYTISQMTRIFWWKLLLQNLTDTFWFLKRFYRINDLLWQDGFLFDFIQKKIVDRWVSTFVMYSGYLFSERLWFDVVVRFYIDFVIWPGYQYSIYEFTSISTTLVTILSLLILLFYMVFLYYLFFLLL